jgi:hypothetical protein
MLWILPHCSARNPRTVAKKEPTSTAPQASPGVGPIPITMLPSDHDVTHMPFRCQYAMRMGKVGSGRTSCGLIREIRPDGVSAVFRDDWVDVLIAPSRGAKALKLVLAVFDLERLQKLDNSTHYKKTEDETSDVQMSVCIVNLVF